MSATLNPFTVLSRWLDRRIDARIVAARGGATSAGGVAKLADEVIERINAKTATKASAGAR